MIVTLYATASYNVGRKLGGYAYWIESSRGCIKKCGPLRNSSSLAKAELQSLALALQVIMDSRYPLISKIIIHAGPVTKQISTRAILGSEAANCYMLLIALKQRYSMLFPALNGLKMEDSEAAEWCHSMSKSMLSQIENYDPRRTGK